MLVAFAPQYNSHGLRDATGAFRPEASAFCRLHDAAPPILFDNREPMKARLEFVREQLEGLGKDTLSTLAFFCHGWRDGLQCGARTRTVCMLADSIRRVASDEGVRIVLYCCDAGRDEDARRDDEDDPGPGGDGGFADRLRDELGNQGVRGTVYAHTTRGHTTHNPYVRRFDPGEVGGGHWIVEPKSEMWRAWVRALRGQMRWQFPFLSQAEIEAELEERAEPVT